MSAKLARQLLAKPSIESPRGKLRKDVPPSPAPSVESPRAKLRKDISPSPPSEVVSEDDDVERQRCRTEDMDVVQRYCHLNAPPLPPCQDNANNDTETGWGSESSSETTESAPETSVGAVGPAKEGSPEISVEAKQFIACCNGMDVGAQVPPLSTEPTEDTDPHQESSSAVTATAPPSTPPEPSCLEAEHHVSTGCNACDCNDFEPNAFKKGKCNNCFHFHDRRNSLTSAAFVPTLCKMEGLADVCTQAPFKDGYCIDHYRLHKKTKDANHKFLSADGKARLSIDQHCDQTNIKFMVDKSYETTREQMEDLKRNFMDMDEDGSGDIDVLELGRAMEKLGKPKNQLQLRKMIAEVDVSGTGTIEYEEFVLMMLGTSSSVLRLILMFEKLSKGKDSEPKGKKKPMIDLYK